MKKKAKKHGPRKSGVNKGGRPPLPDGSKARAWTISTSNHDYDEIHKAAESTGQKNVSAFIRMLFYFWKSVG